MDGRPPLASPLPLPRKAPKAGGKNTPISACPAVFFLPRSRFLCMHGTPMSVWRAARGRGVGATKPKTRRGLKLVSCDGGGGVEAREAS